MSTILVVAILSVFLSCVSYAAEITSSPPNASSMTTILVERARSTDVKGNVHTRYTQIFQGTPVYGYEVIHHDYSPRLQATALALPTWTGVWVEGIAKDVRSSLRTLSPEILLKQVHNEFALKHNKHFIFERAIAEPVIYIDNDNIARYAVNIHFFADVPGGGAPAWPHYILDSVTGEVIEQWDGLPTDHVGTGPGGNEKVGHYEYGIQYEPFDIQVNGGICVMGSPQAVAIDMRQFSGMGDIYRYSCDPIAAQFIQDKDAINGAFSPLNDAYAFTHQVINMYYQWYGSTIFTDPLRVNVHYGDHYENAFWDGESITFGDGNKVFYPLTTLDVISHEFAHGVTEKLSGLNYYGEAGGLNESFSDMAAKAAEFYMYGAPQGWAIGAGIFKSPHGVLRYMDNPSDDGWSIDNAQDFAVFMDPHQSSGVFNKLFYVLATMPGWDVHKAFDVFYMANAFFWYPRSTFATAAFGAMLSAEVLGYPSIDVITALQAVGIQCDSTACVVQ